MTDIAGKNHKTQAIGLYVAVLGVGAAALAYFVVGHGPTEQAFVYLARITARFSFLMFALAFMSTALYAIRETSFTSWLATNRRTLWLAFALAHFIHLGAIIAVYVSAGLTVSGTTEEIVGGLAYVFITLLVILSVYGASRGAGAFARKFQPVVAYYVWFIFTVTYATRLMEPELREPALLYAMLLSVCVAALAIRLLPRPQAPAPLRA